MDCWKLSPDACMHVVKNERLPLHVIMKVLFFEQERAAASFGSSTSDLPKGIRNLNSLSRGSSQSATTANNDDDWDGVMAAEELRALKAELASLCLGNVSRVERNGVDRTAIKRVKGTPRSRKIFAKMLSGKGQGENSGSWDS